MGLLDGAKGLADKAKQLAQGHEKQVDQAVEKVGDLVDDRTGDKYKDQVDTGQELIEGQLGQPE
jgi:antitoxin protein of toxin-antitoxin system